MSSRLPDEPAGEQDAQRAQRHDAVDETDQQLADSYLRQPAARRSGEGGALRDQVHGAIDDMRLDPPYGAAGRHQYGDRAQPVRPLDEEPLPDGPANRLQRGGRGDPAR